VDGTQLSSVAGLRQIRKDLLTSQLVYLPFSAANYRQDVHSGTIRCVAANAAGAVQSQDVHIRASKCSSSQKTRIQNSVIYFCLYKSKEIYFCLSLSLSVDTLCNGIESQELNTREVDCSWN